MDKKTEEISQPLSNTLFTAIQKDILSGIRREINRAANLQAV